MFANIHYTTFLCPSRVPCEAWQKPRTCHVDCLLLDTREPVSFYWWQPLCGIAVFKTAWIKAFLTWQRIIMISVSNTCVWGFYKAAKLHLANCGHVLAEPLRCTHSTHSLASVEEIMRRFGDQPPSSFLLPGGTKWRTCQAFHQHSRRFLHCIGFQETRHRKAEPCRNSFPTISPFFKGQFYA